jgi:hypothetical protein
VPLNVVSSFSFWRAVVDPMPDRGIADSSELEEIIREGVSFPAEIKGRHMFITAHKGGNQGKKEILKYEILDVR